MFGISVRMEKEEITSGLLQALEASGKATDQGFTRVIDLNQQPGNNQQFAPTHNVLRQQLIGHVPPTSEPRTVTNSNEGGVVMVGERAGHANVANSRQQNVRILSQQLSMAAQNATLSGLQPQPQPQKTFYVVQDGKQNIPQRTISGQAQSVGNAVQQPHVLVTSGQCSQILPQVSQQAAPRHQQVIAGGNAVHLIQRGGVAQQPSIISSQQVRPQIVQQLLTANAQAGDVYQPGNAGKVMLVSHRKSGGQMAGHAPNILQQKQSVLRPARFQSGDNDVLPCAEIMGDNQIATTQINNDLLAQIRAATNQNTIQVVSQGGTSNQINIPQQASNIRRKVNVRPTRSINMASPHTGLQQMVALQTNSAGGNVISASPTVVQNVAVPSPDNRLSVGQVQGTPTSTIVYTSNGGQLFSYVNTNHTPQGQQVNASIPRVTQGQMNVPGIDGQTFVANTHDGLHVNKAAKPVQYVMSQGGQHIMLPSTGQIQGMPGTVITQALTARAAAPGQQQQTRFVAPRLQNTAAMQPRMLASALRGPAKRIVRLPAGQLGGAQQQPRIAVTQGAHPGAVINPATQPGAIVHPGTPHCQTAQVVMAPGAQMRMMTPDGSAVWTSSDTHTVSSSTDVTSPQPLKLAVNAEPQISSINNILQAGETGKEGGYVKGQMYSIKYNNGITLEVVWDGEYFKPKQKDGQGIVSGAKPGTPESDAPLATSSPASSSQATNVTNCAVGQVKGGGGGDKHLQKRVLLKGNATGLHMIANTSNAVVSTAETPPMVNGGRKWAYSSVGKDKLARPPAPTEPQPPPAASTPTPPEAPPKPSRPRKETIEGKFAVCDHCGNLSSDYNDCESCHKAFPDDPKYYCPSGGAVAKKPAKSTSTIVYAVPTVDPKTKNVILKGTTGTIQLVPRQAVKRGASARKVSVRRKIMKHDAEPETVTILSSDDEDASNSSGVGAAAGDGALNSSADANSGNSPATPQTPAQQQSRRFKMEDSTGKIVIKKASEIPSPSPPAEDFKSGQAIHLTKIRSVKLGLLRTCAKEGIYFHDQGMITGLTLEEPNAAPVQVIIGRDEMIRIQGHFGRQFPLLALIVTATCAQRISGSFSKNVNGHFFDPKSPDDSHKRIIILVQEFPKDFSNTFKKICEGYASRSKTCMKPLLEEISSVQANKLLMLSAPKDVVNSVKEQQGQIVARQKGQPIVGQVIVNAQGQTLTLFNIPVATEHRDINEDEDDDEPVDRSRSPSPMMNIFSGPIIKLFTYPPAPATGGIAVTNEDLFCLNEGEFLNDVIIDFYLKYLFTKILNCKDQERTHVFSSFFYRRLTQKDTKRRDETNAMTAQQKRHQRVRTWTRHVDLFSKDFIIVPINESAHWYLAIICFPHLKEPVRFSNKTIIVQKESTPAKNTPAKPAIDSNESVNPSSSQPETKSTAQTDASQEDAKKIETSEPMETGEKEEGEVNMATPASSKKRTVMSKQSVSGIEKQPCILIFDSLSGPSRSSVVRTLREYLQVEWDIKKKDKEGVRVFDKDHIKGANPRCPQQTNYSDCGIYVLEYVESFFKRPIEDYTIPIKTLAEWFPDDHVAAKRQELRDLILQLQKSLNPSLDYDPIKDGCLPLEGTHMDTSDTQQLPAPINSQTELAVEKAPVEDTALPEETAPPTDNL